MVGTHWFPIPSDANPSDVTVLEIGGMYLVALPTGSSGHHYLELQEIS